MLVVYLNYATDVLGIGASVVERCSSPRACGRRVDPLVGYWSDRTRSRLGRARAGCSPRARLLVSGRRLAPPASLSGRALVTWIAVAVFGF